MSSFDFYANNTFASCQYHADEFFLVLDYVEGEFPLMNRARDSFEQLIDDVFSFSRGEPKRLHLEIKCLIKALKAAAPNNHAVFFQIIIELENVFIESQKSKCDIQFRWG